jgi:hypothetical protein
MTEQEMDESLSDDERLLKSFQGFYDKVIAELDVLYRGVFDSDEGNQAAALCLLAQAPLIKIQAAAEFRARSLKRDIDFKKAEVYSKLKSENSGKKMTEAALQQLLNQDLDIHQLYDDQNKAEKEAKELANILSLLRDAHITFRSIAKKGD